MLTVRALAKLNLTLEVLGKRQDGFHEIRSVMQTISLSDSLSFQPGQRITFKSDLTGWLAAESLVSRATGLLQQVSGCMQGVSIEVTKHIPLSSGLGGDSSDAAAVLLGLNQFWQLGLSPQKLLELARQLGSDVSFFLYGGTALLEGRGEIVTPLPPLPHRWVVLVMPPVPRLPEKTKRLYESLRATDFTDGQNTQRLVEEIKMGREFTPSLLCNTFENVASARFPGLDTCREQMVKAGAADVRLAGSGPALFSLVKDKAQAEGLYARLKQQKLESYLAETLASLEKIA
ncbi:MAG: 4-(cytidine 5'-diphospho)-2-C-methyl-D-erythritol kinase [Dehalococcoidales bacterium]|nr:4-(cytidine 5'-diphospho)-2-C-methyl-D-erythritol kinase [Dehalococcoidales bacterium]